MHVADNFIDRAAALQAAALLQRLERGDVGPVARAAIRATLRYWLSPIDLIPDFVPKIGALDDYLFMLVLATVLGASRPETLGDVSAVRERVRRAL